MSPQQTSDVGSLETVRTGVKGGIIWGAVGVGSARILQFVTTLILARILSPEHFGALAIALVVQTIAINVTELGATAAIGRADRDPQEIAPTIFTISLATSAVITCAVIVLAPSIAEAMGDPAASGIIQIMSITILLAGISGVPAAVVWRNYLQRPRAMVEIAGAALALALVVPMALAGWGAFALAWSRVGGQLLSTAGYWIVTPLRVRPGFSRIVAAEVLRLGLPLAFANLVVFFTLNLDYIIVGRELGGRELGVYLLAFNLASLPSSLLTAVIRTVAVPTFGRLHSAGLLASAAPGILGIGAYLAMPMSAMLVGLATPLVNVLYGDEWRGASGAMIGLGIFGAGRIVSEMLADLCVGGGRTVGLFWVQVVWLVCLFPALLTGVLFNGTSGVGAAHAIVMWLVVLPVYFFLAHRAVGARVTHMLLQTLIPASAALVAGVASWSVASLVPNPLPALMAGGVTGIAIYFGATWTHARKSFAQLKFVMGRRSNQLVIPLNEPGEEISWPEQEIVKPKQSPLSEIHAVKTQRNRT